MSSPSPIVHIVDDDGLVRTALRNLLSAAGFEVRTYSSATEFLLSAPKDNFGARELDVYKGVVAGLLNKQIAAELGTSERTVKAQRAHVMERCRRSRWPTWCKWPACSNFRPSSDKLLAS